MSEVNEIHPLKLVKPDFDDHLTDILLELNHLRKLQLMRSTQPQLFFQIRAIFHLLESVGSARIEGNHTTVPESFPMGGTPLDTAQDSEFQVSTFFPI